MMYKLQQYKYNLYIVSNEIIRQTHRIASNEIVSKRKYSKRHTAKISTNFQKFVDEELSKEFGRGVSSRRKIYTDFPGYYRSRRRRRTARVRHGRFSFFITRRYYLGFRETRNAIALIVCSLYEAGC